MLRASTTLIMVGTYAQLLDRLTRVPILRSEGLIGDVCIVSEDPHMLKPAAEKYGAEICDLETAVGKASSAIVPEPQRTNILFRLVDAGIHVLVEGPIAGSLDEGLELARLARGLILSSGTSLRYHPATGLLREMASKNPCNHLLTEFVGLDTSITNPLSSAVDLSLMVLGEMPRSVVGMLSEYWADVLLDHGCSSSSHRVVARGPNRAETILISNSHETYTYVDYREGMFCVRENKHVTCRRLSGDPILEMYRQFLLAVTGRQGAPPPLRDALIVLAVLDAVKRRREADLEPALLKIL